MPRQSFAGHGRETMSFDGSSTCLEPFPIAVYVGFVDPVAPTASRQRFREFCPPSNVELDGGAARAEAAVRRRERPGLPRDPVARPRPLETSQRHADAALSMKRWNGCRLRQLVRAGTPSRAVKPGALSRPINIGIYQPCNYQPRYACVELRAVVPEQHQNLGPPVLANKG